MEKKIRELKSTKLEKKKLQDDIAKLKTEKEAELAQMEKSVTVTVNSKIESQIKNMKEDIEKNMKKA